MSDSDSEIEQGSGSEDLSDVEENDSDNNEAEEGSDQEVEDESDDSDEESDDEEVPQLVQIEKKINEKLKKDQKKKGKENKKDKPVKEEHESAEDILKKYEELKGKQLFIRFPVKLPKKPEEAEEFVKKYCDKIIKVHRPRQKSVRHCLVDFVSEADRNKAKKELSKVEIEGKKLIIQMPKSEDDEYIKKIVDLRKKKLEKLFEKKQAKKLGKEKDNSSFTSTLSIENIPSSATAADIKALFPSAVELRFTVAKGIEDTAKAIVTLPSTKDATTAKRSKLKIGENNLIIKFATKSGNEKKKKNKKNKNKSDNANKPQKGNKQKPNNKRKLPQDGKSEDQATPNKKQKKNKNKPSEVAVNGEAVNKNENRKNKNKQKNKNNSNNQVKNNENKNKGQQNAKNKQKKEIKSNNVQGNGVGANKKVKKEKNKKKVAAAN